MKKISTNLREYRFLDRMNNMCRQKEPFDKGYEYLDVFVVKWNGNRFRIGYHAAHVGRTDGYMQEHIYGEYCVVDDKVEVTYRFAKPLFVLIPYLICVAIGLFLTIGLVWNGMWKALYVPVLFLGFGSLGLFWRSKKDREFLDSFFHRICLPNKDEK